MIILCRFFTVSVFIVISYIVIMKISIKTTFKTGAKVLSAKCTSHIKSSCWAASFKVLLPIIWYYWDITNALTGQF